MTMYDFVGIGTGPFNLSTAALAASVPNLRFAFFDKKDRFNWHDGLLLKDSFMQTSFLKDLVTLSNPTSPYSFLNYLHENGLLYDFMNAGYSRAPRFEFTNYMRWVSENIAQLHFGAECTNIAFEDERFFLSFADGRRVESLHVVLGTGREPLLPECAKPFLGQNVFHGLRYNHHTQEYRNKNVVIVGGGQTASEIFLDMLHSHKDFTSIKWFTRRDNIDQLDESQFVDEFFRPNYTDFFYNLSLEKRHAVLDRQKFYSDGATPETVKQIYQEMYHLRHFIKKHDVHGPFLNHNLKDMKRIAGTYTLTFENTMTDAEVEVEADVVILATGLRSACRLDCFSLPAYVRTENGEPLLNKDYSVVWEDAKCKNKIFLHNGAKFSHGIADPNLSLLSWKSGVILNSLVGSDYFPTSDDTAIAKWEATPPKQTPPAEDALDHAKTHTSDIDFLPSEHYDGGLKVQEIDFQKLDQEESVPFKSSLFSVPPGCSSPPDKHKVKEYWLVLSGEGTLSTPLKTKKLTKNSVVSFDSYEEHTVHCTSAKPLVVHSTWWD